MEIKSLINIEEDAEWIQLIGKYMLNMGALETISRFIIMKLNNTDNVSIYSGDLAARMKYLKARFPNYDKYKHQSAMNFFSVLERHIGFRNIIAHSGIMYTDNLDSSVNIIGLVNLAAKDHHKIAEVISIEELRTRVTESANLGQILLEIQNDFTLVKTRFS